MVMNSARTRVQLSLDIPLPVCSDLTRAAHVNNQPAPNRARISPPPVTLPSAAAEAYNPFLETSPTHSLLHLNYPIIPTKSAYPFPRTPTSFTPTHSPTLFEDFYNMAPSSPLAHSASRSLPTSPTNSPSLQRVLKSHSNPSLKIVFDDPLQPITRVKSYKQLQLTNPSPLSTAYTPSSPTQSSSVPATPESLTTPRTPMTPATPSTPVTPVTISITSSSPKTKTSTTTFTSSWPPVFQASSSPWTPTLPFTVQPLPCLVKPPSCLVKPPSFVSPV